MLNKVEAKKMGGSNLGWLQSHFHFSFAEYYNPENMNFGALRVLNDDLIAPNNGFDMHPHRDMEILTYVIDGELTHQDSMGNESTISRGHVQYMSAGTGVFHSEHNYGSETLRLLQIWILPDRKDHTPHYGDFRYDWDLRHNKFLQIASGKSNDNIASIKINQDVNFYVIEIDEGQEFDFEVDENRQAYLIQIEGSSDISGITLNERDALEITEEDIFIVPRKKSHIMIIEMAKN